MILNISSPYFKAITKSDTAKFSYDEEPVKSRFMYFGGTGDAAVKNSLGETVLIESIPAGTVLQVETDQLLSTNTTVTKVIAFF